MSFQAYIENIKTKTGKTPADFKKMAEKKKFIIDGKLNPKIKATEIPSFGWSYDQPTTLPSKNPIGIICL